MGGLAGGVFGGALALRRASRLQSSAAVRWLSARREGVTFAALGVLSLGLTLYLCAPGYLGPDSRSQFQQARDFYFSDDHPVLMALVWHYLDRILPGPLGMLVFTNVLYWGGLSALCWLLPGPIGWRALGFLVVGFLPPGFSSLPIVYKDPLMHGALFVAIACVAPHARRALTIRVALGVVCFLLAVGVRHNGAAAAWPFLALPFMRLPLVERLRPWLRLFVGSVAGLLLAFAMTVGLDRALASISHRTEFWQTFPKYDLAGMSVHAGKLLVDPDSPVFTEGMGLEEIQQHFQVDYSGTLYQCFQFRDRGCLPLFRFTLDRDELARLSHNWRSAIAKHPWAYLAHRWDLTLAMLTVNTSGRELYWLSTAPHSDFVQQYPPSERLQWVLTFMERHIQFIAYSPWVYVVLGLLLFPLTLRRYLREGATLPLLFLLSGGAYLVSILIGASSSTYRYCVWTMLCTLLALLALLGQRIGASRLGRFLGHPAGAGGAAGESAARATVTDSSRA